MKNRITSRLEIFEEATRNITAAAEKSLKINSTDSSWPVCCTLNQEQVIHQNRIQISHWRANESSIDYDSSYLKWVKEKDNDCRYFPTGNIEGCFCESVGRTGGGYTDQYHRWDGVLLETFQTAAERFKQNGYDQESIPLMYVGTQQGFLPVFPLYTDLGYFKRCHHYDPRIRPWYPRFITPKDRQIVFLIDRSSSMSTSLINGEFATFYTRRIVDGIVKSLKGDDLVRFFSFGNTVKEINPLSTKSSFVEASALSGRVGAVFDEIETDTSYELSFIEDALAQLANSIYWDIPNIANWDKSRDKTIVLFTDCNTVNDCILPDPMSRFENAIDKFLEMEIKIIIVNLSSTAVKSYVDKTHSHINVQDELEEAKDDVELLSLNIVNTLFYNKRSNMADYDISDRPLIYSRPYFDFSGSGELITVGQPIYDPDGKVFGAVGIDINFLTRGIRTTTNLNLGIFDGRFESYIFILKPCGLVIYHPFKPFGTERPSMYYDVEKDPIITQKIRESLTSNDPVEVRMENCKFPVKLNYDGTNMITDRSYNATYRWQRSGNFIIGIVLLDHERPAISEKLNFHFQFLKNLQSKSNGADFSYHSNIDNQVPHREWERINERIVNYQRVMTMFGVQTYRIEKLFDAPELKQDVDSVRQCLKDIQNCETDTLPLTKNALIDICDMSEIDTIWTDNMSDNSVLSSVYGGTPSGVFKIFPGFNISVGFEPTRRPWYIKAATSRKLEAVTYKDHIWEQLVVTLSKAVVVKDEVRIVLAIDLSVDFIIQLVEKTHPNCKKPKITCSLVDKNGIVIIHQKMSQPARKFAATNYFYYQEYEIYRDLEERGYISFSSCVDLEKPTNLPQFIQIVLKADSVCGMLDCDGSGYTIQNFGYFNSYLIVKTESDDCISAPIFVHRPWYQSTSIPCNVTPDGECKLRSLNCNPNGSSAALIKLPNGTGLYPCAQSHPVRLRPLVNICPMFDKKPDRSEYWNETVHFNPQKCDCRWTDALEATVLFQCHQFTRENCTAAFYCTWQTVAETCIASRTDFKEFYYQRCEDAVSTSVIGSIVILLIVIIPTPILVRIWVVYKQNLSKQKWTKKPITPKIRVSHIYFLLALNRGF